MAGLLTEPPSPTEGLTFFLGPLVESRRGRETRAERGVKRYFDNGNLKGSGKPNTKWIRKNKNTEGRDIHVREIKDSAIPSPTDEGLTDDDIDPIKCANCDAKISILWASPATQPEGWSKSDFKEENNHSLVIRVRFGASTFLFPGDMQDAAIESLVERYEGKPTLDVDVIEVNHHGAENGTTAG